MIVLFNVVFCTADRWVPDYTLISGLDKKRITLADVAAFIDVLTILRKVRFK